MTVHEIELGGGVSRVGSDDSDSPDDYTSGHSYGYAAARRGQSVNPTIHRMSKTFRAGYLDGYDRYGYDARRWHRLDMIADGDD